MEQKGKKKSIQEIIAEAAEQGAQKALMLQQKEWSVNYYRAMELLLWAYPKRVQMLEHPEDVDFFQTGRSRDISIAPPPGTGVIDKIEAAEMYTEARKKAFEYEMRLLYETAYAMAPFQHLQEFIIIRMFYFNEDVNGNYRGPKAKRLTFEEIAEALESVGIHRSVTAIRRWRSSLVRDMTVMRFGAQGALSIESRVRQDNREVEHSVQETDQEREVLPVQQEKAAIPQANRGVR